MNGTVLAGWAVIAASAVGAVLIRSRPALRLALSLVAVLLLTWIMLPLTGSPLDPQFHFEAGPLATFSAKCFIATWWLLIARMIIATGQIALGINHQRHAARLLSDLAAAAIYLGALLAVIDLGFGVSVAGLVATSGIIAIVLGLALQSTLSDLFSGVAIGIDRPFKVGDIVVIEGAAEGKVIETNWRSTRIATAANDVATVPNSVVAKARITNRSAPSDAHLVTVKIVLDPAVPPRDAIAMLHAATLTTKLLPAGSPVSIVCTDLRGEGAVYEMQFSVAIADLRDARSDLLDQIVRHARYNGVALAPQDGTALKPVEAPSVAQLLGDVSVLRTLPPADRELLVSQVIRHEGKTGETIFSEGGAVASLFLIARGSFEVSRRPEQGGDSRPLGSIGPGDYFGELALLTGSPNAATVTALTPYVAYEVGKAMIAPFLESNPVLLHDLEAAASKARALLDRTIAAQACPEPAAAVHMLDRIRAFFNLGEDRAGIRRAS